MQMTTISEEVHKGNQSLNLTEVISVVIDSEKHKLRVEIKSDSYKEQCFALIKRWTGSTWNEVHKILTMRTKVSLAYKRPTPGPEAFKDDRAELLRVAERVLA